MSYQALLFCPDEKTARTVTQILGELDFNVTACNEPFAAVKKLMGERFDAVVVDCENEQNATLLFKSARSAPSNQGALAVAIVEGQAGVAKAFRIGANLVLTKPINVEQTKGTLRVARGLLRKNEGAKPANGSAVTPPKASSVSAAPAKPASQPSIPSDGDSRTIPAAVSAPPANMVPAAKPAAQPSIVGSDQTDADDSILQADPSAESGNSGRLVSPPPMQESPSAARIAAAPEFHSQSHPSSGFAASAPAPAREPKESSPVELVRTSAVADEEIKSHSTDRAETLTKNSASTHTLTFGGTVGGEKPKSSSGKNVLMGAVAAILIAAAGYAAWMKWSPLKTPAVTTASVRTRPIPAAAQVAPTPGQQSTPAVPEAQISDTPAPAPQNIETSKVEGLKPSKNTKTDTHSAKEIPASKELKEDASILAENAAPASTPGPQPIVIKSDNSKPAPKPVENTDAAPAPALSMSGIAPAGEPLPALGSATAETPVLQRLVLSQGVSRGLLIKEVQPVYPATALAMRIEGAVQLMATITKTGNISEVKAVSGDKELAHAALAAVKQWKYKPYLLNGEPVEIQTQVTVNFKLPQ